jgi:hypothetical protein
MDVLQAEKHRLQGRGTFVTGARVESALASASVLHTYPGV